MGGVFPCPSYWGCGLSDDVIGEVPVSVTSLGKVPVGVACVPLGVGVAVVFVEVGVLCVMTSSERWWLPWEKGRSECWVVISPTATCLLPKIN